ncbi:type VI secretion system tube protein TssD [Erwinia sorbitola]|uniref:Type VI secretion system tube protein Hcp n=1 Tax=Erwinia sorbitola TaxID=2681984 RepID=A0A6I6EGW4_9GAMM|nr:type VI secretion system tube protein TssD [Erwinia sorbitola]QGU87828.1 type VI secretion system tube protein Hcp [Erwinia sorbitola]
MAIPVYLTLEDEGGKLIKGGVDVSGREGSIEILELMHNVELPTDDMSGKITGTRIHTPYAVMKEIDCSSSILNRYVTSGRRLARATLDFYAINYNGQEENYFKTVLEGVRVRSVERFFQDFKDSNYAQYGHLEYVELAYEKISWHFIDGNIIHSDSWNERS